jgi:hypothetical protein
MKDKTPKKKKLKGKKTEEFDPKDAADIKELTQKALTTILQNQLSNKSEGRKNTESLAAVIEEFLTSYIILGYSLDGTPIHIISAHNQQEADSLTTLVNKFINHNPLGSDE